MRSRDYYKYLKVTCISSIQLNKVIKPNIGSWTTTTVVLVYPGLTLKLRERGDGKIVILVIEYAEEPCLCMSLADACRLWLSHAAAFVGAVASPIWNGTCGNDGRMETPSPYKTLMSIVNLSFLL